MRREALREALRVLGEAENWGFEEGLHYIEDWARELRGKLEKIEESTHVAPRLAEEAVRELEDLGATLAQEAYPNIEETLPILEEAVGELKRRLWELREIEGEG